MQHTNSTVIVAWPLHTQAISTIQNSEPTHWGLTILSFADGVISTLGLNDKAHVLKFLQKQTKINPQYSQES